MHNLSLYGAIANRYQHLLSVRTVAMMNIISHHIEQQVIKYSMPIDFYVGFQRFSAFPQQARRYQNLGAACQQVYVFGFADVVPTPMRGVEYIGLSADVPLTYEWFLLVDAPEFWTLLSTREIEGVDPVSGQRRFEGMWTFDAPVVESASQLLSEALGQAYRHPQQRYASLQDQNVAEVTERINQHVTRNRSGADLSWDESLKFLK